MMDGFLVSFIVFECLVAIVIVVGNCIVCYVIWKSPELQRKVMFIFIFSLSVADMLVGLVAIPCSILTKLGLPHDQDLLCISMLSFIMIPTQNSIFNMSAIAIERFAAVKFPIYHVTRVTPVRARYATVVIWILSTIVGCLPMLGWNRLNDADVSRDVRCLFMQVMSFDYMAFNFFACILPPIVITVILYYVIFTSFATHHSCSWWLTCSHGGSTNSSITCHASIDDVAAKSAVAARADKEEDKEEDEDNDHDVQVNGGFKKNGVENCDVIATTPSPPQEKKTVSASAAAAAGRRRSSQQQQQQHDQESLRKRRKELKTAGVLLFLVLSFIVCWMPIHICNMIFKFSEGKIEIPAIVIDSAVVTSHSSSAFNFFLYSWRLRSFKIQIHKRFPFLVNNRPL